MQSHGRWRRISLVSALIAGLLMAVEGVAAHAAVSDHLFMARGSAGQVYATGVTAGARVALLNPSGQQVATETADPLGGVIFYEVAPGTGYRVRLVSPGTESGPVTVHSGQSAPWDPRIYDQSIPDQGYGYVTTRDGTALALDVHPPTSPAGLGVPPLTLPSGLPDYAPPYPTQSSLRASVSATLSIGHGRSTTATWRPAHLQQRSRV